MDGLLWFLLGVITAAIATIAFSGAYNAGIKEGMRRSKYSVYDEDYSDNENLEV